jgi:heterodisulfide reductase subunit C
MSNFLVEVNERIGEVGLQNCFHCLKCSSGCPMASAMEYKSNEMIRMVQFGERERLLRSSAIWICVSCETCVTRCPNAVDIPRMIDILREMALESGIVPAEPEVVAFHRSFLDTVKLGGRVNEPLMMVAYKARTGTWLKDLGLGVKMFLQGKLALFAPLTRNRTVIRRIFRRTAGSR